MKNWYFLIVLIFLVGSAYVVPAHAQTVEDQILVLNDAVMSEAQQIKDKVAEIQQDGMASNDLQALVSNSQAILGQSAQMVVLAAQSGNQNLHALAGQMYAEAVDLGTDINGLDPLVQPSEAELSGINAGALQLISTGGGIRVEVQQTQNKN